MYIGYIGLEKFANAFYYIEFYSLIFPCTCSTLPGIVSLKSICSVLTERLKWLLKKNRESGRKVGRLPFLFKSTLSRIDCCKLYWGNLTTTACCPISDRIFSFNQLTRFVMSVRIYQIFKAREDPSILYEEILRGGKIIQNPHPVFIILN